MFGGLSSELGLQDSTNVLLAMRIGAIESSRELVPHLNCHLFLPEQRQLLARHQLVGCGQAKQYRTNHGTHFLLAPSGREAFRITKNRGVDREVYVPMPMESLVIFIGEDFLLARTSTLVSN
jgi:hypothetical protein